MESSELPRPPSILDPTFEHQARQLVKQAFERIGTKHSRREARGAQIGAPASAGIPQSADVGASASVARTASGVIDQLKQARALTVAAKEAILLIRDREISVTSDELELLYDRAWDVFDSADELTDLIDSFVE